MAVLKIISIKFIIVLSLQAFIIGKGKKNENIFYKFSINQDNKYNDFESNQKESFKIHFEVLFNIYSKIGESNEGYIILLKYSKSKKNVIKEIQKNEKDEI